MANDEIKFLPIFQILDIKNIWFLLELEMALTTAIKKKFELVCLKFKAIFRPFCYFDSSFLAILICLGTR